MSELNAYLKKGRYTESIFLKPVHQLMWIVYCSARFIFSASYRNRIRSVWKYKDEYHQFSTFTKKNRYPDLFNKCQLHFKDFPNPKILSYGCSSGEEVESIGNLLPDALITGVDINMYCIKKCNKNYNHPNWSFTHSLSADFLKQGTFNAIFCLAVFQHPENRHKQNNETSEHYSFMKFETQVELLDEKLEKGGLLFIDHSDFNFLQTKTARKYSILETENNRIVRDRPSFDFNNKKISDICFNYRIFIKNKSA